MSINDEIFFTNRRTEVDRSCEWDARNNTTYEGIIQSVSPLNRLNGTCIVYVPKLFSYLKADMGSGFYFTGSTSDYQAGDNVRLSFMGGKTERPVITGSLPRHPSERALTNEEVPIMGTDSETNGPRFKQPSATPEAVIPGAINHNYQVSGVVERLPINADALASRYYPASATWFAGGSYFIYPADRFDVKATKIQLQTKAPAETSDPVLAPLAALTAGQPFQVDPNIAHQLTLNQDGAWVYNSDSPVIGEDPLLAASQEIFPLEGDKAALVKAQQGVASAQLLEGCLSSNVNAVGDLLSKAAPILAGAALEQLNDLLPDSLKVGLGADGSITVGPLTLDPKTGVVTLGQEAFAPALSAVNDLLPDFLGFNLDANTLGLGDIKVDLDNPNSSVLGGFNLEKTTSGLTIKLGDQAVRVVSNAVGGVLAKPLSSLNNQLPTGVDVKYTVGKDGLPEFEVGPLKVGLGLGEDGSPAALLDPRKLATLTFGQLNNLFDSLVKQAPRPALMLAQLLWEQLDLGGLLLGAVEELLGGAVATSAAITAGSSISNASYNCGAVNLALGAAAPVVVSPDSFLAMEGI